MVPSGARWIDSARCFSWRGPEGQGMRLTEEEIRQNWRGEKDWKISRALVRMFVALARSKP